MRVTLLAVVAALVVFLGCVQFASASLFAHRVSPDSIVARIPPRYGVAVYSAIERVAPAPYIESMLAWYALDSGNLADAEQHAHKMPNSAVKSELLGRIAEARDQPLLAREYFLVAPDVDEMQAQIATISRTNAAEAFDLEVAFKNRLESLTTHPDAVADAYWRMGQLTTLRAYLDPALRGTLFSQGLSYYNVAIGLAPLSERYILAAGSQALLMRDDAMAQQYFTRGIDVDPTSADAYAGLGIVAFRANDLSEARFYAAQSHARDPHAHILSELEHDLANVSRT
jgi:tetratricopeptide (TPR) repeat protein